MKYLFCLLLVIAVIISFGAYGHMMDRFSASLSANLSKKAIQFEPDFTTPASDLPLLSFAPEAFVDKVFAKFNPTPLRKSDPEPKTGSPLELTPEEATEGAQFVEAAYKQLEIQLKKPQPTFVVPEKVDFARSGVPIRRVQTIGRALYGMAYSYAQRKNTAQSLRALASLGSLFVSIFPDGTMDHDLKGYAAANGTLETFGTAMLITAEHLRPAKAAVLKLLDNHAVLERQFPPPAHVLQVEKRSWLSLGEVLTRQGYTKENPCYDLGGLMSALDAVMTERYDPFLPLFDKPWPEVQETVKKLEESAFAYAQETEKSPILRLFPRHRAARRLLHLNVARFSKQFRRQRNTLSAGFTVFALESYRAEKGSYPASLKELATWLGKPIGKDGYTNAEFVYTATPIRLSSPGEDLKPGTPDDLVFLPAAEFFKTP